MSWNDLPHEIKVYILKLRYDIRNISAYKIQKSWFNYLKDEEEALDIALDLEVDQGHEIMICLSSTPIILERCIEKVSGNINRWFWLSIIESMDKKLYEKNNIDKLEQPDNYHNTERVFKKLLEKFKING